MATSGTTSARSDRAARIAPWLDAILAAAALSAAATLVLEYGQLERAAAFQWLTGDRAKELVPIVLAAVQGAALAAFALDRLIRLALADRKADHLRGNWIDFALILAVAAALAAAPPARPAALAVGVLYLLVMQGYTWLALLFRSVGRDLRRTESGRGPALLLAGTFVFLCGLGSLLLFLPAAVSENAYPGWDFVDALFTATSAATCTGLALKDTAVHFTFFGQLVILLLVQAGALAVMLIGSILAMLVGRGLSAGRLPPSLAAQENDGCIARTIRFVLLATLAFEALGAALLVPMFRSAPASNGADLTAGQAVWYALFHSISAFCNAGFTLYRKNLLHGVSEGWSQPLRDYWQVYGVIAPLIVFGGLGMAVLQDVGRYVGGLLRRTSGPERPSLTRHSRVVLATTAVLILVGAAVLLAIESAPKGRSPEKYTRDASGFGLDQPDETGGKLHDLPPARRLQESCFQSISARTAGFHTVEVGSLSPAGVLWMCVLMTIGGSPGGAAGGMKVTTLAVLVLAAWQVLRRRDDNEGSGRNVGLEVLRKAVMAAVLYTGLVGVVTVLLCVATGWDSRFFLKLLLEACSACGNAGFSMEVSERLGRGVELVKGALIGGMFLGRIGAAALMLAMVGPVRRPGRSPAPEDIVVV
jgi:trk system potassium uptake protein TrkH